MCAAPDRAEPTLARPFLLRLSCQGQLRQPVRIDALDLRLRDARRRFDVAVSQCAHLKAGRDRKSTRLNSSHGYISYAVFCLKKKKKNWIDYDTRIVLA